jgi:hypothetical protein
MPRVTKKNGLLALWVTLVVFILLLGPWPFSPGEPVSASPDRLKWSIVDSPSAEGNVVVSPSEINAFAFGSEETFYAADIPNSRIYKSTDGGFTWEDKLTAALEAAGANLPGWDIAVAPDDPDLIAVVSDNRTAVYASDDGGENWDDAAVPDLAGFLISDIALSPAYGDGERDIAIGTRLPNVNITGDVWARSIGISGWKEQELHMDVSSIRFSFNYYEDKAVVAIAGDEDNTFLCVGERITNENRTYWYDSIEIADSFGDSPSKDEIIISDLALRWGDYSEDAHWTAYAGYYSTTDADDVYRVERDGTVKRLDVKGGGAVPIASIDYGGGRLLAGEVLAEERSAEALIRICSNPGDYAPKWEEPEKPPTGGAFSGRANAQVAWGNDGGVAYCATSTNYADNATAWADVGLPDGAWRGEAFDESAFSRSEDSDSGIWNQLSLIDTDMSLLSDYAVSMDTEGEEALYLLYLASMGAGFDSIWRSESEPLETLGGTWERILCFDSETDRILLRRAPGESGDGAIFFAAVGTEDARYSLDEGETWQPVWDCPEVTDLAVVSDELFYILDDELVNKCWWNDEKWEGIWEWERDVDTGLPQGYSIATSGGDFVFVGEENGDGEGRIAYSIDGALTFELTEATPDPGNMEVVADEEFASNRFIYAASSEGKIYRWTIGGSTSWSDLSPPHEGFCGLAETRDALYGAYDSGVDRTLVPHVETVRRDDWDSLEAGLEQHHVDFEPGTLRATINEAIDLWAIDGQHYDFSEGKGCLWVYSDIFALTTPWPISPATGELMLCDTCTCQATRFCFRWRELALTEKYELRIALDEGFAAITAKVEDIRPVDLHAPAWCPPQGSPRFTCSHTYYWKLRACESTEGERIHSRWSPVMSFTVKTCASVGEMHVAPILVVPGNGSGGVSRTPGFSWIGFPETTEYEFVLAADADSSRVIVREEVPSTAYQYRGKLDWGGTYLWRVRALEPVPSEQATGVFTVVQESRPAALQALSVPLWIWVVIGTLALLIIAIIVLCLVKR